MIDTIIRNAVDFIALSYLTIKLQNFVSVNEEDNECVNIIFILMNNILGILAMIYSFQYNGRTFDLRAVPLFLVTYLLGWKAGLLASILPIIYLAFGRGESIIAQLAFLMIIVLFIDKIINYSKKESRNTMENIIGVNDIVIKFIIFNIVFLPIDGFIKDLSFSNTFTIYTVLFLLSIGSLIIMVVIINDLNKKKLYKYNNYEAVTQLKTLADISTDAVIIHTKNKIVYGNYMAAKLFGTENVDGLIGNSILDFILNEDREDIKNRIEEIYNGSIVGRMEQKILKKNGNIVYTEVMGRVIPYRNEIAILSVFKDITKQKLTEKDLEVSKEKYWKIFDNIEDAVALIDVNSKEIPFKLLEVNYKICKELGYKREELLNLSIYDLYVDKDKIAKTILKIKEEKRMKFEIEILKKDGGIIPVEVNSHLFKINSKEVIIFVHRDISELKKAHKALEESERRYRTLVEGCPDAVFVHQDHKIIFANEKGARILGFEKVDDIIGRQIWEFIPEEHAESVKESIYKAMIYNITVPPREEKIIKRDGRTIDVDVSTTSIYFNGNEAIFELMRDITERKEIERTLKVALEENKILLKQSIEYDKLKTDFFSNVSHELKTPLNIILGCIQLMEKTDITINEYNKLSNLRYIKMMKQNCYRLLRLINNLIDITRMDTNYMKLDIKNYDVIRIIEEITMSVAEYIKSKGISLIFDTEIEEKIIACDADKIERIMLNLLSNAVKFTDKEGNIWVNIYDKGDNISISVKDNGVGIPKDKIEIIFERFRQVDPIMTRNREGSGIGLSLVEGLVKAHGGKIRVESEVGKGSEFIIDLPVKQIEDKQIIQNEITTTFKDKVERINIEFSDIYS